MTSYSLFDIDRKLIVIELTNRKIKIFKLKKFFVNRYKKKQSRYAISKMNIPENFCIDF
jgi:hypothetical protein